MGWRADALARFTNVVSLLTPIRGLGLWELVRRFRAQSFGAGGILEKNIQVQAPKFSIPQGSATPRT